MMRLAMAAVYRGGELCCCRDVAAVVSMEINPNPDCSMEAGLRHPIDPIDRIDP